MFLHSCGSGCEYSKPHLPTVQIFMFVRSSQSENWPKAAVFRCGAQGRYTQGVETNSSDLWLKYQEDFLVMPLC